jgi:general stress protein YciG
MRSETGSVEGTPEHEPSPPPSAIDPNEAPETPTDEPPRPPVKDPSAEPDPTPYVVGPTSRGGSNIGEVKTTITAPKGGTVNMNEHKERRGFASMATEKQREIASKGGRAAHQKGTAHEWTSDEARSAGRKGGQISRGGRGRLDPAGEPVGLPPSDEPSRPTDAPLAEQ